MAVQLQVCPCARVHEHTVRLGERLRVRLCKCVRARFCVCPCVSACVRAFLRVCGSAAYVGEGKV
jgi:hypothetical protein